MDQDIKQIEQAASICIYTDEEDKRISRAKVIEMLGREDWLSGLSRAAFHWTASRGKEGQNYVRFDCSKLFR